MITCTKHMMVLIGLATGAIWGIGSPAEAAMSFSDSLKGGALPSAFNLASDSSGRAPSFTANGVQFAGDGDGARNYLRTNDTVFHDANTISTTAFLTVETQLGKSFGDDSQLFFGLGTGDVGQYGVPDRQENQGIYANLNNSGGLSVLQTTASGESGLETVDYPAGADQTRVTTTAIRMIYDQSAETVQYDLDFDYAGDETYAAFTSDLTTGAVGVPTDVITAWNGGAASSIVFGGDSDENSDLLVSDFRVDVVIPEPASGLLAAMIGIAGLGGRRIRFGRARRRIKP